MRSTTLPNSIALLALTTALAASSLRNNLEPTLDLLAAVLREPTFPESEWELMRSRRLLELMENEEHPTQLCYRAMDRMLYGEEWLMVSSVDRDATADAVAEVLAEVRAVGTDRPVTAEELDFARSNRVHSYPAQFEQTGYLLGQVASMWRYGLMEDWISGRLTRLRAVTLEGANAALTRHLDPDAMVVVVVGDLSAVRDSLDALGLPTVDIDRKGNLLTPMPGAEAAAETETETETETD
ncbi:MAG: hypothetical protein QGH45_19205 [Myxococcota bacterium]|nr:hypothetical protein [Myxococcota bacterium]